MTAFLLPFEVSKVPPLFALRVQAFHRGPKNQSDGYTPYLPCLTDNPCQERRTCCRAHCAIRAPSVCCCATASGARQGSRPFSPGFVDDLLTVGVPCGGIASYSARGIGHFPTANKGSRHARHRRLPPPMVRAPGVGIGCGGPSKMLAVCVGYVHPFHTAYLPDTKQPYVPTYDVGQRPSREDKVQPLSSQTGNTTDGRSRCAIDGLHYAAFFHSVQRSRFVAVPTLPSHGVLVLSNHLVRGSTVIRSDFSFVLYYRRGQDVAVLQGCDVRPLLPQRGTTKII
ncbi:hypothetical protein QBC35DRAFT_85668 [Podospora australis]|uniref:Uncharacterized protein n=1 Tax=Podospora australis TaxID=1536484 RepID=A0AAN7AE20_9PEZI|nr:hypothetical protein QBC35DRAFT_85668 [Podospora australis]